MNAVGRQRSGAPPVHHQRQYSDNYLEASSNGRWLQSVGLQHLQSSNIPLPPSQDVGYYGGGQGSRMYRGGPQRTQSGGRDIFAEPLKHRRPANSRRRNGDEDGVWPNDYSPGLLDLHCFDTELLPGMAAHNLYDGPSMQNFARGRTFDDSEQYNENGKQAGKLRNLSDDNALKSVAVDKDKASNVAKIKVVVRKRPLNKKQSLIPWWFMRQNSRYVATCGNSQFDFMTANGLDGYTIEFFQQNWTTVGEELMDAIELFFKNDFIYYPINTTAISLIPKVDNPINMKEFRPISCCNVIYKIISKVLVNRLKPLLPLLVGENQGAFIKGRTIQDNILLMHEMVKNYKRKGGPSCCAVKVDIMKAFDTVNWKYLMMIMKKMNFPEKFKHWIWLCISTASFSVNLNGSLVGNFTASRGLRQGDPLSPCLFILIMEGFSQLLKGKITNSNFKFHSKCDKVNISSLAFADDLFILARADLESIQVIKDALTHFQDLSGLQPNLQKCEIFTSGTSSLRQQQIADTLGMKLGRLPIKYLGLPLVQGRLSYTDCGPLLDKLNHRVQSWAASKLSYGGRLQLINAVLMAICRYWTSSMFLPRRIIREVERILKQFLWGGTRKAKVKWSTLCLPKEEGGLGISDLTLVNDAYIMKNLWSICQDKESLWVKWVHSVILKGKSVWEAKPKQSDSWIWKRMLWVRDKFSHCITRIIGNGESTSFWEDPWHPWGILSVKHPELRSKISICANDKVSRVIQGSQWRIPYGRGWDEQVIAFNIACSSIAIRGGVDFWKWTYNNTDFSIKNAIIALQPQRPVVNWHRLVWCKHLLPRYAVILWLACWKRMVTQDKLMSWGIVQTNICVLCGRVPESHEHLFFQCTYAANIWEAVLKQLQCRNVCYIWQGVIDWLLDSTNWSSKLQKELATFGFAATVYGIWRERNNRFFQKGGMDSRYILKQILDNICYFASTWRGVKKNRRSWELAINLGIPMKIFNK